jgi:DNA processing protein
MNAPAEAERAARAALTWVAEPGDQAMGALLRVCDPAEVVTALIEGRMPRLSDVAGIPWLERALPRWAARLGDMPPEPALDRWRRNGIRLVIPGDTEWPSQLDVLGDARPWGLWVSGHADLRFACLRSVSVVGTRAATGYGAHVCGELAITLAGAGWTIVSGGAWETADTQQRSPTHASGASHRVPLGWPTRLQRAPCGGVGCGPGTPAREARKV